MISRVQCLAREPPSYSPSLPARRLRQLATAMAVLMCIILSMTSSPAIASQAVELASHVCFQNPATSSSYRPETSPQPRDCARTPEAGKSGWIRAYLDNPSRLASLAGGWHLLLPHRQLEAVLVVIEYHDGTATRLARTGGALAVDWATSGHAAFALPRPGSDVRSLAIAYRPQSAGSTLSYLEAVSGSVFTERTASFLIAAGLYVGAVGSALIYNLFIGAGRRSSFQRIYIIWSCFALLNGLITSGLFNGIWPIMAGWAGVLTNRLAVAGLFSSGIFFLLALVEPGVIPRFLDRCGRVAATAIAATGILATVEPWLPFNLPNQITTACMFIILVIVLMVAVIAVRRGSRSIWFYIAGWVPIFGFAVFFLVSDLVELRPSQLRDIGGMLAVAFESVMLSLAIADRFRQLQRDHDDLERARHVAEADRKALQCVAETDQMTGISNRRVFEATLSAARRGDIKQLTLVLIDLDHFKSVNDRLGHEAGDEVLVEFSRALRACVRSDEIIARLGGDEFAILITDGAARVEQITRELMELQPFVTPGNEAELTISVGIAHHPNDDVDPTRLYRNADLALYEAKRLGRARSHRYEPRLRAVPSV